MLFGNNELGFDGLIDLETRKKLWNIAIERIETHKAKAVVDSLQLEMPKFNTENLEDDSEDKTS